MIEASPRVPLVLARAESFLGSVTRPSASCRVEGASPEANPAGAPSGNRPLLRAGSRMYVSLISDDAAAAPDSQWPRKIRYDLHITKISNVCIRGSGQFLERKAAG